MGIVTKRLPQSHLRREVVVIFVAIGTTDFDALIQAMDRLSLNLSDKVVMQIGRSEYIPEHCEYFRFVPSLVPYYERASLVVSHGGLGILTEVLERRLPLIAVEDPNQPDRHQRELLSVWEREGYLIWCKDLQKLPEAVEQAKTQLRPYVAPECQIHTIVAEFLDSLEQQ
jgi:UDP-N-acetylglucosamine transferase subunit ALG13